jgi:hypothetical protein
MKERTIKGLGCTVVVIIYLVAGWLLYIYVLKPLAKGALHYFAPPTIEQNVNTNKSKSHRNK